MISSFTNSTTLTSSQIQALLALFKGKDIFLTGEAGTGKSYILELYIKTCRRAGLQVVALAPSSTAALNLSGGTTMSRTLGISSKASPGLGDDCFFDSPVLEVADVIVLDEISTCRVDLFDCFWAMIERAREKGGAGQVVVAGDFFQLPPIVREGEQATLRRLYPASKKFYAFEGEGWKAADLETCVLTEVVRQSDLDYIANLSLARKGDAGCIPFFNNRAVSRFGGVPDDAIRLVGTNRVANETNDVSVDNLVAAGALEQDFDAVVTKGLKSTDMCVPRCLRMVVGARVMLCADLPRLRLENGHLGIVTALHERSVSVLFDGRREPVRIGEHTWKVEKTTVQQGVGFMAGGKKRLTTEVIGSYTQLPLKLAFAITVHKAQGKTFGSCIVDPEVFDPGMLYVALSRCADYSRLFVCPSIREDHFADYPAVGMPSGALSASAELAEVKNSDKGYGLWDYTFTAVGQEAEKRVRLLRSALPDLFPGLLLAAEKIRVGDADTSAEELAVPEERGENLLTSEPRELLGFEDYDGLVGELIPDDLASVLIPSRYVDLVRGFVDDLVEQDTDLGELF